MIFRRRNRGFLTIFTEKTTPPLALVGFWRKCPNETKVVQGKTNYTNLETAFCPCTHQHLFLAFSFRCVTRGWQLKKKARFFRNIQTKKTFLRISFIVSWHNIKKVFSGSFLLWYTSLHFCLGPVHLKIILTSLFFLFNFQQSIWKIIFESVWIKSKKQN